MLRSTTLFAALDATLVLQVAAAETLPQVQFNHKDWEIACNNTRTCRAAGYQPEDVMPNASVLLTRQAGPNQAVIAELPLVQTDDDDATPASLQMTTGLRALGTIRIDREHRTGTMTPEPTAAFVTALPKDDANNTTAWSAGKVRWSISKMGANAVLLKMDAFQRRLGTPGTLIRKGNKPEASVLPALPSPVVVSRHIKPNLLQPTLSRAEARLVGRITQVGKRRRLRSPDAGVWRAAGHSTGSPVRQGHAGVGCMLDRRLRHRRRRWVANRNAPHTPRFITASANDNEDGILSGFQKGSGIADCIAAETWTWDGRTFVHTSATTSGMCCQFAPGSAWDFSTLVSETRRTR